ncbi:MAG TPA: hypothetical protein VHS99_00990, partial [Chloroflexota bacterium]|nr:hypothetical protein [Chloroflexota bacterium]
MATEPILPTKLYRAPPRPDRLPRPRLMARLAEALTRRLTLVSAPAGAGKTTLLSEWQVAAAGQGWLVAWVSLDAGDNDPPHFWGYCLAALSAQRPGLGQTALALLRARPSPPPRAILTALIADLAQVEHEVALILDDYHVVEAASIHEGVAFLVDHLPPRAHLVLSGRADPPLPLARLRARGELAELRAAELAFSADESAAFLERVLGPRLAAEDAAVLAARTEGWAAGLHLAALALQGRAGEDARAFVQAFAGTHRYILDYLAEEVLEAQPAEVQEFLLLTAILDRLCGPLCDAVTGRRDGDGQELLESLERANLFLIPLDDERRWYRYHHLFADLLRARLRHRLAEGVPELHRRAAAWLERHQMVEEALRHLLAAGDEAAAAALVERHEVGTSARGEVAAVQRWVNALPPGLVRERPRLAVLAAAARVTAQELDQVEPHLRDAERALARLEAGRTPERPGSDSGLEEVPGRISFVRAALAASRDDSERAIEHARQALERLPAQSRFFRGVAAFNLATAYWANGDLPAAHQLFLELAGSAVPRGEEQMTLLARFALGQVLAIQGRLREAGETHRHTLRLVAERGGAVPPTTGVAHLGLGEVLREWDDLPAAARHAEAGVALCFGTGQSSLIVAAHVLLARVRLAAG